MLDPDDGDGGDQVMVYTVTVGVRVCVLYV